MSSAEIVGLSDAEVAQRRSEGKTNEFSEPEGRSVAQIVGLNVLTPVNAIMIVLFVLIVISGHVQDGLFAAWWFRTASWVSPRRSRPGESSLDFRS